MAHTPKHIANSGLIVEINMPTKLAEMKRLQEKLIALQGENERLANDPEVKRQSEIKQAAQAFLIEYNLSLETLVALMRPGTVLRKADRAEQATARTRRPRRIKIYTNPHNEEVVRTSGGNHKVLKAWSERWGRDVVRSWWVYEDGSRD